MSWNYTGNDPGLALFNACLKAGAPIQIAPGARVLEVGCCEADWLHLAAKAWPETAFVGIDTRAQYSIEDGGRIERHKANVIDATIFKPESFDAVVSLSAIEHIGLGHYKDPKDPDGDSKAMANIWCWLKPSGWVYFDVPYDPSKYYLRGAKQTECRVYDDEAILKRLAMSAPRVHRWPLTGWAEKFRGYSKAKDAGTLVEKPTAPVEPFHYVALLWRKEARKA